MGLPDSLTWRSSPSRSMACARSGAPLTSRRSPAMSLSAASLRSCSSLARKFIGDGPKGFSCVGSSETSSPMVSLTTLRAAGAASPSDGAADAGPLATSRPARTRNGERPMRDTRMGRYSGERPLGRGGPVHGRSAHDAMRATRLGGGSVAGRAGAAAVPAPAMPAAPGGRRGSREPAAPAGGFLRAPRSRHGGRHAGPGDLLLHDELPPQDAHPPGHLEQAPEVEELRPAVRPVVVVHGHVHDLEAVLLDLGHHFHADQARVARELHTLED